MVLPPFGDSGDIRKSQNVTVIPLSGRPRSPQITGRPRQDGGCHLWDCLNLLQMIVSTSAPVVRSTLFHPNGGNTVCRAYFSIFCDEVLLTINPAWSQND